MFHLKQVAHRVHEVRSVHKKVSFHGYEEQNDGAVHKIGPFYGYEVTGVEIIAKKKLGGQPSLFLCLLQAKQIYLLSAVATSTAQATLNLPLGCYRCRVSSCELCIRVYTTHSVGHSLRSEYQHLP